MGVRQLLLLLLLLLTFGVWCTTDKPIRPSCKQTLFYAMTLKGLQSCQTQGDSICFLYRKPDREETSCRCGGPPISSFLKI